MSIVCMALAAQPQRGHAPSILILIRDAFALRGAGLCTRSGSILTAPRLHQPPKCCAFRTCHRKGDCRHRSTARKNDDTSTLSRPLAAAYRWWQGRETRNVSLEDGSGEVVSGVWREAAASGR